MAGLLIYSGLIWGTWGNGAAPHAPSSRRRAQVCSHSKGRVPRAEWKSISTFQPSSCVTFAHILLAKARHIDELSFFSDRNYKVTQQRKREGVENQGHWHKPPPPSSPQVPALAHWKREVQPTLAGSQGSLPHLQISTPSRQLHHTSLVRARHPLCLRVAAGAFTLQRSSFHLLVLCVPCCLRIPACPRAE